MTTGPPAPDDLQRGNGQLAADVDRFGRDRLDAQRDRLASFWALVMRRFREYTQRNSGPAGNGSQT